MKPFAPFAPAAIVIAAVLTASASAQSTFTDPANLRGERVVPLTGRELPIDQGATGLEQLLRKLNTRASLMLIVAHPDDEDGGMLTFYSRGLGARVADLSLNRGEGGQNLMTGDFEDALGLLRTQELLAADRYFDADQFFGTEVDFGFSKTKEEAFAKWTHERVLYDVVRAIRIYRPLVIASVFIGGVTDGHGQHQVAGQITQEAFKAAGDPNVFPELTREGILPWQPFKVYARVPMQAITPQGLFDYATGQYAPAKFTNYVTGEVTTTTPSADVTVHEGKVDPLLGPHRAIEDFLSYVQFARQGLGLQKSQIGGNMRIPPPGPFDISYHRYGSMLAPSRQKMQEDSFFDGIDTSLAGIADLAPTAFPELHARIAKIQADINVATDHLDPNNLEKIGPELGDALQQCDALLKEVEASNLPNEAKQNVLHELRIKRVQLNDALALSLGIALESMVKPLHKDYVDPLKSSDRSIYANVRITNHGSELLTIIRLNPEGSAEPTEPVHGRTLPPGASLFVESNEKYLKPPSPTRPYFSRTNIEQPFYDIADPALRNAPTTPDPLISLALVEYRGAQLELRTVVPDANNQMLKTASPEILANLRTVYTPQAAVIIPPVTVRLGRTSGTFPFISKDDSSQYQNFFRTESSAGILPLDTATFQIGALLTVEAFKDSILGPARIGPEEIPVTLHAPLGWQVSTSVYNEHLEPVLEHFTVSPGSLKAGNSYLLTATATFNGIAYGESFRPVGYPGLPYTNYYTPATYRIVPVDLKLPEKHNIAYLPGTGDAVPEALVSIGLKPTILAIADLTPAKLAQYDTVILGVRTYAAHPDLHGTPTQALLDYAKNGGNVVVQYQTGEFTAADAPFPLAVGNAAERVIDETDPVQLLASDSPLLTIPNKITPADFDSWIEERGHGFLRSWDSHYTALTETHDPGDPPQRGGLVTTPLGKGRWTYCAYALYRQLPEAVPGAFRLFVNLINP